MNQASDPSASQRPLSALSKGARGQISRIEGTELEVALLKLGIAVGDQCKIANIAPLGDPIAILVDRTQISLRKQEAGQIWIQPSA
ncbi:MAG: FeoA family protein [Bacteroidota bacterium]